MSGNFGSGYTGFKTVIELISEGLGGDRTREAVAFTAEEWLVRCVEKRHKGRNYTKPSWTLATDLDFDDAAQTLLRIYADRTEAEVRARAPFEGGAEFVLVAGGKETAAVYLRGGGYRELVVNTMHRREHNYRTRADEDKYDVYLTNDGARIQTGSSSTYSSGIGANKNANVKSVAASFKSARNIMKNFFNVELIDEPKS